MPDLFLHFSTGYLPATRISSNVNRAALVLGVTLPDILARIPEIVLGRFLNFDVYHFFSALHTPFALLFASYALSYCFPEQQRKLSFIYLLVGAQAHIMLDLLQEQFHEGIYMPFFPFSLTTIQYPVFHKDASLLLFPVLAIVVVRLWYRK